MMMMVVVVLVPPSMTAKWHVEGTRRSNLVGDDLEYAPHVANYHRLHVSQRYQIATHARQWASSFH
jgi:hypothetical protein